MMRMVFPWPAGMIGKQDEPGVEELQGGGVDVN